MRRTIICGIVLFLALSALVFGAPIGSIDPTQFTEDTIDWCVNFGCSAIQYATPQAWYSNNLTTGWVGLANTGEGFYNLQQGSTWAGNFNTGMGLIYTGSAFGNTPTDIVATFDFGQYGAGAYIQANDYGSFIAKVTAYDINYQPLFTFTQPGVSAYNPGNALFIGVLDAVPSIYALQFDAIGVGPNEPDFAIGSVLLATPEPSTLVLMGLGLLAAPAFFRGRKR